MVDHRVLVDALIRIFLSHEVLFAHFSKLPIVVRDFLSQFVVFGSQIAYLAGQPIDLGLAVLIFLHQLLLQLLDLFSERINFITISLARIIGETDVFLPLFDYAFLGFDFIHLLILHFVDGVLLLLAIDVKFPLVDPQLLHLPLILQLLLVQLDEFHVVMFHGFVQLLFLVVKDSLHGLRHRLEITVVLVRILPRLGSQSFRWCGVVILIEHFLDQIRAVVLICVMLQRVVSLHLVHFVLLG